MLFLKTISINSMLKLVWWKQLNLKKPFSLKFEPVKSIDHVIFELPLDTMTSIRGELNIKVKKKTKFNYPFLHNY